MKSIISLAFVAFAGLLHGQTAPPPSLASDEPLGTLELPPALVFDEDGKASTGEEPESGEKAAGGSEGADKGGEKPAQADDEGKDGGIQIQVEKTAGKSSQGTDGGKVRLYSPWPAKPISSPPAGWTFVPAPEGTAPYKKTVELEGGRTVELAITPYVLVPSTDGRTSIRISEPGYDAARAYDQKETVGAMLRKSTGEIEAQEKQAADAIRRLQQLLTSLPRE